MTFIPRVATIISISLSLGRGGDGSLAAARTLGRVAASPTVLTKIPSWLSTQLTALPISS